ncbi:4-hydroxy-tetrahydrodipicolinate reductase [Alkalicaulis satelles]|uniref:4-hydroxy-tetrahydrodipicolinate reductase n=1 Tax=Alkalicaulis satelles TaxID=2609175 RepID=A0A5M6ZHL7_9PROT|nr:4-hydroxy-tetrahydrodipicolinate reductase [Alkalicaulis satelles]KAA5803790.1 4-hydroxy-tetrahydrodipicolinate reductase [Alkalicaulis satelles]
MTDTPFKICVAGVSGRLGRSIAHEVIRRLDTVLTGALVSADSVHRGADAGEIAGTGFLGLEAVVSLETACEGADMVIDASLPDFTAAMAGRLAARGGPGLVTGVTGLSSEQQKAVETAARMIPVLQASNFSLGVAVMERLLADAARLLPASEFDLEIVETHHRRKTDAPSGTALMLGRAAARARGEALEDRAVYARPRTGGARKSGEIGFSAVRGGGVTGEHEARFLAAFEEITLTHRAFDRYIFARGAVEAALWLKDRPAGLYSMQDLLGAA